MGRLAREREKLVKSITRNDFDWHPVSLGQAGTVEVCSPVRIGDIFVPVTALETFALARNFGFLPLTRAVADQAHLQAVKVAPRYQSGDLPNYEKYSKTLLKTAYDKSIRLVSGSHKVWVLSSRAVCTNYGFYRKQSNPKSNYGFNRPKPDPLRTGKDKYSVVNTLLKGHDFAGTYRSDDPMHKYYSDNKMREYLQPDFAYRSYGRSHWDYSQLLQLMRGVGSLKINDNSLTLKDAVRYALPPVWDESPHNPHDQALKLAGLRPAEAATLQVKNKSGLVMYVYRWRKKHSSSPWEWDYYTNVASGLIFEEKHASVGEYWGVANEKRQKTLAISKFWQRVDFK